MKLNKIDTGIQNKQMDIKVGVAERKTANIMWLNDIIEEKLINNELTYLRNIGTIKQYDSKLSDTAIFIDKNNKLVGVRNYDSTYVIILSINGEKMVIIDYDICMLDDKNKEMKKFVGTSLNLGIKATDVKCKKNGCKLRRGSESCATCNKMEKAKCSFTLEEYSINYGHFNNYYIEIEITNEMYSQN